MAALQTLAADCRAILGPGTKIGYAADWSEYFGHQPGDGTGDLYFHLDPLWADANINFIGVDNYMPLSDWRDGTNHLDTSGGWSRSAMGEMRSARKGILRAQFFDDQGVGQEGQLCQMEK